MSDDKQNLVAAPVSTDDVSAVSSPRAINVGVAASQSTAVASHDGGNPLRRTLSTLDLFAIGVGGIIGAGIYVLTGTAAALYAGPAISISFVISGAACAFSALTYSELSTMIPIAGSAYTFTSLTLGQFVGFAIGHDLILEYLFGAATVAVGWSGYARSLLCDMGACPPAWLCSSPIVYSPATSTYSASGGVNLPAVAVIVAMTAVNVRGVAEASKFNTAVVALKVVVLLLFVFSCIAFVKTENYSPFVPPATDTLGVYGWTGVLRGSATVFFAYVGFDALSTASQEARNPQRSLPIATIGSLVVCTALYIAVSLVLTGLVPYHQLNVPDPIAVAVDAAGPSLVWLRPVVKIGALLGLTSVIGVLIMGQARITYTMADDGMLPSVLATVHPRYKTPWVATVATGVIAAIIAAFIPIDVLGEMVSIGTLSAFVLVNLGVLVLRRRSPTAPRPFRTPCVPAVPLLGAASALLMMVSLPLDTWIRLFVWMAVGVAIYMLYSRHHAKPLAARRSAVAHAHTHTHTLSGDADAADTRTLTSSVHGAYVDTEALDPSTAGTLNALAESTELVADVPPPARSP